MGLAERALYDPRRAAPTTQRALDFARANYVGSQAAGGREENLVCRTQRSDEGRIYDRPLLSYLAFEGDYIEKLVELGFGDTMARAEETPRSPRARSAGVDPREPCETPPTR